MYTAESLSHVFLSLIDLFGDCMEELLGIVYDRACDLHPFVLRLAKEGNVHAEALSQLQYIVDIFHAEKHTRPKCVLGNDQCYYHPHLEKFEHVRKMNTEVAEQSFTHITPFKSITRKMRYGKRLVYLKLLDDYVNERMVRSR